MNKKWMRTSCLAASAIALLTAGAYSQQKSAPDSTQKDLQQKITGYAKTQILIASDKDRTTSYS